MKTSQGGMHDVCMRTCRTGSRRGLGDSENWKMIFESSIQNTYDCAIYFQLQLHTFNFCFFLSCIVIEVNN